MLNKRTLLLSVDDLILDFDNPRLNKTEMTSEADIIKNLFEQLDSKSFINLAQDIVENGLNPISPLLIIKSETKGKYIVLEGNRRLSCLKLLADPDKSPDDKTKKQIQNILSKNNITPNKIKITCSLVTSREMANKWIELEHADTAKAGLKTIPWDSNTRAKWGSSKKQKELYFQIEDLLSNSPLIPNPIKAIIEILPRTNITRLFNYVGVRALLNYSIEDNKLLLPDNENEKKQLLANISKIILHIFMNKLNVTNIKNAELATDLVRTIINQDDNTSLITIEADQLIIQPDTCDELKELTSKYESKHLNSFIGNTIDKGTDPTLFNTPKDTPTNKNIPLSYSALPGNPPEALTTETDLQSNTSHHTTDIIRTRPSATSRKFLITYSLKISENKINEIFKELKKINLDEFIYSASTAFRVFLELSCDWYIYQRQDKKIIYRPKKSDKDETITERSNLYEKIRGIAHHFEKQGKLNAKQLESSLMVASDPGIGTITWLHACVHNYTQQISKNDLINSHDNLRPFIEAIWNKSGQII